MAFLHGDSRSATVLKVLEMAVIFPDIPLSFNGSAGESEVFDALRSLPDRCSVFHSLAWLNPRKHRNQSRPLQGEADFLIVDPQNGLLVIEVKGGGVRFEGNQWIQTNTATGAEIRMNPVAQANRSAHFLRDLIVPRLGHNRHIGVFHAVWFPSVRFTPVSLPLDCPREIVLDQKSLWDCAAEVERVFKFWQQNVDSTPLGKREERLILELIAPAYGVVPSFRSTIDTRERQFIRLTSEQARIIEYLDEQDRAVISGTAGSGKTVLALESARRLSSAGEDVVFLCYNSALRRFLRAYHPMPRVSFETFHSLAAASVADKEASFEKLEQAFLRLLADDSAEFNLANLIIDEAQDFDNDWIEWLAYRTRRRLLAFYDRNQLLFQKELSAWIRDAGCRLTLKRTCRNTQQIARTVSRSIGVSGVACPELPSGRKPMIHVAGDQDQVRQIVKSLVAELVGSDKFAPADVAILTPDTTDSSAIDSSGSIAGVRVSAEYGDNSICFTTIKKFKGLEAKALILVDVQVNRFSEIGFRRLFYVGCSRAVHELHIVVLQPSNADLEAAINALGDGTKRANNMRSVSFLLASELINHAGKEELEQTGVTDVPINV
jgi:Nuclease-related domain/UvrD-like helicase C-terminal domain/AAA domain